MRTITIVAVLGLLLPGIISCKKEIKIPRNEISQEVKDKIVVLGFSARNAERIDEGYLVENDIVLSDEDLDHNSTTDFLRIAGNEQYHTSNLLTALPRAITINLSGNLPSSYSAALDEAIRRYNAENLLIHFQRKNENADIDMIKGMGNYWAISGLPSPGGMPYRTIKINSVFIGNGNSSNSFINHLATIMAHEIGHCIGFRHTDYMDRSFSCGGQPVNEGPGSSGAISIYGTPTTPDSGSWMLVCLSPGQNRPFNRNDQVALNYLY